MQQGTQIVVQMGFDKSGAAVIARGITNLRDLVEIVADPLQVADDGGIGGAEAPDQDMAVQDGVAEKLGRCFAGVAGQLLDPVQFVHGDPGFQPVVPERAGILARPAGGQAFGGLFVHQGTRRVTQRGWKGASPSREFSCHENITRYRFAIGIWGESTASQLTF